MWSLCLKLFVMIDIDLLEQWHFLFLEKWTHHSPTPWHTRVWRSEEDIKFWWLGFSNDDFILFFDGVTRWRRTVCLHYSTRCRRLKQSNNYHDFILWLWHGGACHRLKIWKGSELGSWVILSQTSKIWGNYSCVQTREWRASSVVSAVLEGRSRRNVGYVWRPQPRFKIHSSLCELMNNITIFSYLYTMYKDTLVPSDQR